MGLLDQLWDDTVAGPRPDSGLGKLRKYASFSPSSSAAAPSPTAEGAAAGSGSAPPAVTRSITMLRPAALSVITSPRSESSSAPSSPSPASGPPDSPFGAGDHRFSPSSSSVFFSSSCCLCVVFRLKGVPHETVKNRSCMLCFSGITISVANLGYFWIVECCRSETETKYSV
jgi:hypothetical protein